MIQQKGVLSMTFLIRLMCFVLVSLMMVPYAHATSDVQQHWARDVIARWTSAGLIGGYPDGTFRPKQTVTRAQWFSWVNRAFGFSSIGVQTLPPDVPEEAWFAVEVLRALHEGYVRPGPKGAMRPRDAISRQEVAWTMTQLMTEETPAGADEAVFAQWNDSASWPRWSQSAIARVLRARWMQGDTTGAFRPRDAITRAEALTALDRMMNVRCMEDVPNQKSICDRLRDKPAPTVEDRLPNHTQKQERIITQSKINSQTIEKIDGDIRIAASGVVYIGAEVAGDVVIDAAVGTGAVTLQDVSIGGVLRVFGGGEAGITLSNVAVPRIEIGRTPDQTVRIRSDRSTPVAVRADDLHVRLDGSFADVRFEGNRATVVAMPQATIAAVTVPTNTQQPVLDVQTGARVQTLNADAFVSVRNPELIASISNRSFVREMANKNGTVRSLVPIAQRSVVAGTAFDAIGLPNSVAAVVAYDEVERTIDIPVRWDASAYDPQRAQTQIIRGELVLQQGIVASVQPTAAVIVTPARADVQERTFIVRTSFFGSSSVRTAAAVRTVSRPGVDVWLEKMEKTSSAHVLKGIEHLASQFTETIQPLVHTHFGSVSDINSDGKVAIFIGDMPKVPLEYDGYVSPEDLRPKMKNSNKMEVVYMSYHYLEQAVQAGDTTSVPMLITHEYQHLTNANPTRSMRLMDVWLDEALSMAAEHMYATTYGGRDGLQRHIHTWNASQIQPTKNGLTDWQHSNESYALSYLYLQYVRTQVEQKSGKKTNFFKEIVDWNYPATQAVERVLQKYVDASLTFDASVANFAEAVKRKEQSGVYGFGGERFFDALR
jgi:hypothetical protein